MKTIRYFTTAGVGLFLVIASILAAYGQLEERSIKKGHELAKRLCTNCHVVDSGDDNTVARGVAPSFLTIANFPEQTQERLAGKIIIPHPDMPTVPLTRAEIKDIIAYMMSKRQIK